MKTAQCLQSFSKKIHESLEHDIESLIVLMYTTFDMYDKQTDEKVTLDAVKHCIKQQVCKPPLADCCVALTKSNTRCIRKAQMGSEFCAQHAKMHFYQTPKPTIHIPDIIQLPLPSSQPCINSPPNTLQKKFVHDSLYFVDDQFIYDITTKEKVGYISTNGEYTLTDNPFELQ